MRSATTTIDACAHWGGSAGLAGLDGSERSASPRRRANSTSRSNGSRTRAGVSIGLARRSPSRAAVPPTTLDALGLQQPGRRAPTPPRGTPLALANSQPRRAGARCAPRPSVGSARAGRSARHGWTPVQPNSTGFNVATSLAPGPVPKPLSSAMAACALSAPIAHKDPGVPPGAATAGVDPEANTPTARSVGRPLRICAPLDGYLRRVATIPNTRPRYRFRVNSALSPGLGRLLLWTTSRSTSHRVLGSCFGLAKRKCGRPGTDSLRTGTRAGRCQLTVGGRVQPQPATPGANGSRVIPLCSWDTNTRSGPPCGIALAIIKRAPPRPPSLGRCSTPRGTRNSAPGPSSTVLAREARTFFISGSFGGAQRQCVWPPRFLVRSGARSRGGDRGG